MSIQGTDDRTPVAMPPTGSYLGVVAVDTPNTAGVVLPNYRTFNGSGIAIDSNHVLTANHVINGNATADDNHAARVTPGVDVPALPERHPTDINAVPPNASLNVSHVEASLDGQDMALLTTTTSMTADANVLGMAVFYDNDDLGGLQIITAGYPGNPTTTYPDTTGRTMLESTSPISFTYERTFWYRADTMGGQSGSGVWLDIDQVTGVLKDKATDDLLVGIHTNGGWLYNSAQRITPTIYKMIGEQMDADAGANAAAEAAGLPVNFLVGSNTSFWSFLPWAGSGNDYIDGTYRREHILGQKGNDHIEGGGADDTIDGGDGVDQALYAGEIGDYTITITDATNPDQPKVTIAHTGGNQSEGTDTVSNVEYAVFQFVDSDSPGDADYGTDDDGDMFFVPLLTDLDDPTKLRDGELLNVGQDVLDTNSDLIGTMSLEIPAFMFDGDVNYTLTIGAEESILYNFAYIVDSSGSMSGQKMTDTKAAYVELTNALIDQGVADRSNFAVVDFDSYAYLYPNLDAQGAISRVNSLVAGGGTVFSYPLARAEEWFETLPNVSSATNIAYFLSDGQGSGASASLQLVNEQATPVVVDVRAFGIGAGADLNSLNTIDSGSAVMLSSSSGLIDAFSVSGIDKTTIDHIDVKVDGTVVDTILPAVLVDGALGLTYEGSLDNLTVTIDAENIVTFDLVFNNGTPTATIQTKITTGQTELRTLTADGTTVVALAVNQADYILQGTQESVVGNVLDNTFTIDTGDHEIKGMGGDDTFIINGGTAVIDGGDGKDIAVFSKTRAEFGSLNKTGGIVSVGTDYSLVNVEFLQFTDGLYRTDTLALVPVATVDQDSVTISESDAGTLQASFTVTLSAPSAADITLSYETVDDSATAGADYVAALGDVIFAAGETQKTISFDILDDALVEGDEQFFVDLAFDNGGAMFQDATTPDEGKMVAVGILDDETQISTSFSGDTTDIVEGSSGGTTTYELTVERFGDVSQEADVDWAITGHGVNSVDANDFAGGVLPSGTVTFAAGESTATISIEIAADTDFEADEQFEVTLTPPPDLAEINDPELSEVFTILNDDAADVTAPTVTGYDPADDATNIAVDSNIEVTFSEPVQRGTGLIEIHAGAPDGAVFESYDAATSANLTIDGSTLSIDPSGNLVSDTHYYLTFADGTILDLAGNAYHDDDEYDFTTQLVEQGWAATGGSSDGLSTGAVVAGIAGIGILAFVIF